MSEKSKMAQQLPYDPNALSLVAWRNETGRKLYRYNRYRISEFDRRNGFLKGILHAKGLFTIKQPFYCSYGSNIYVGRDFQCGRNATFHDAGEIHIGDHVQMGNDVKLITSQPVKDPVLRRKHMECAAPITIKDNVYIGHQVVILPGVTIGAGSIISDGSIVYEDVAAGVVAGGNPCALMECESECCTPFQGEQDNEEEPWMERLFDRVNLDQVDKVVHAVSFVCGVYLGAKAVQQVMKKRIEIEEQKEKVEKYLPILKEGMRTKKAGNCTCRLRHT